jgi:hypothetical protein
LLGGARLPLLNQRIAAKGNQQDGFLTHGLPFCC